MTIQLGNGQLVSVGAYVTGIKLAKANPTRTFTHGLSGWWSETGAEILADYRRHIDTVINRRASYTPREASERRTFRHLAEKARRGLLPLTCRWCGSALPNVYQPKHARFCEASCQRAYHS